MAIKSPNILFLFTDQQRADTLGSLNPVLRTPALDRLYAEGTTFTQAYTPVPVCVPARCSLIFGQYATKTGCYENNFPMPAESRERPTFMSALSEAGYQTYGIGKMHFTPDPYALRGFEGREISEELHGPARDAYVAWLHQNGCDHILDPMGVRSEMYYIPQPAQMPAHLHHSHWVADRSLEFLHSRDRSRPFLLWSSFIHPHPPFSPPVPWNKLYRAPSMPLPNVPKDPENFWTYINHVQNRYKYRDAGIDDNLLRAMKAYYYGCISFIDYNVGRILHALEQSGELENTLIVYTSDHGEFLGDYHCFGKRSFLKSAANIPLIARYPPRFAAGHQCSAPASLVDIFPTFLAAAGIDTGPLDLDGIDLVESARQSPAARSPQARPVVFGHYQSGGPDSYNQAVYMALEGRWKYIYSAAENREYLFDLIVDPHETRNRAETLGYTNETRRLRGLMLVQLRADGCSAVMDGQDWRIFSPPPFPRDPDAGLLFQDAEWATSRLAIPGYTDDKFQSTELE